MADLYSPEDEAVLYVLDELSPARRREFQARMHESPELCALVRGLEEGAVALSMASTPRRPPRQIWSRIEKEVQRETSRKTSNAPFWIGWWRSGWGVAAASLAGWAIYAILTSWHGSSSRAISQKPSAQKTDIRGSASEKTSIPKAAVTSVTSNELRLLQTRTAEAGRLHHEIAELERQTGQLSQLLVQQRALLGESNRLKFYQLTPASPDGGPGAGRLSPALQRAIFLSIGRQLGWLPMDAAAAEKGENPGQTVNFGGVDFVDLRPTNNSVAAQPTAPQTESQATNLSAPTIPAFASGNSLIVAVDPTVVPTNSYLTFTLENPGSASTGGSIYFGNTPTVVTIPLSADMSSSPSGWTLDVASGTPLGPSNITQYFITTNH